MKKFLFLVLAVAIAPACDNTPATPDPLSTEGDMPAASQQEAVAEKKLTIEQAAEEATKLIEADAKAEMDAAMTVPAQAAQ